MNDPRLPVYVTRADEQIPLQPHLGENATLYGFFIDADPVCLQSQLDKFLNTPSKGALDFRAILSKVMLVFTIERAASSASEDDVDRGFYQFLHAEILIPTRNAKDPAQLSFFAIYAFTSSGLYRSLNREVYGIMSEIARINIPDGARWVGPLRVFPAIVDRFSRETLIQQEMLLEVAQIAGSAFKSPGSESSDPAQAFQHIVENMLTPAEIQAGVAALMAVEAAPSLGQISLVNLKQFPDAGEPTRVSYQAVVEGPMRLAAAVKDCPSFRGAGMLAGDYIINIRECDSHPLVPELGLAVDASPDGSPSGFIRVFGRGFFVDLSYVLDAGRVLHRCW